jgi:hypothetical protein
VSGANAADWHRCPGPRCDAPVPYEQLACPRHWAQVPLPMRRSVTRAWARGAGAGTPEHTAAIVAAVRRMTP